MYSKKIHMYLNVYIYNHMHIDYARIAVPTTIYPNIRTYRKSTPLRITNFNLPPLLEHDWKKYANTHPKTKSPWCGNSSRSYLGSPFLIGNIWEYMEVSFINQPFWGYPPWLWKAPHGQNMIEAWLLLSFLLHSTQFFCQRILTPAHTPCFSHSCFWNLQGRLAGLRH